MERLNGIFDLKELAAYLRVSTRMISKMRDAGKIPPPVYLGRSVRWFIPTIEIWVRTGCPVGRNNTTNRRS